MDAEEFMKKAGLTDADLGRLALPYERGDYEADLSGAVLCGSHAVAVGAPASETAAASDSARRAL